ncbi:hypothetical protein H5410_060512 [Solanum commersonii]|uniref:Uncharacterized protein n=1 Tax=Solanum commersonii TaxID=4109 RepID=A0A9J5W5F1_SOLCO|nr:hypothetical protein H5410_060512 [Solanum commersonii]
MACLVTSTFVTYSSTAVTSMSSSPRSSSLASVVEGGCDISSSLGVESKLSINVIDNDKVIELLQSIKDPDIRAQIIDTIGSTSTPEHHINEEIPIKEGSYTISEVKKLLLERKKLISSPTTISDLKHEINNLKEDIHRLKENNVSIKVRLDNIESLRDLGNNSESPSSLDEETNNLNFMKNLYLKNDIFFYREGLIPSRYFHKTTHSLCSANGSKMGIEFKLPKAFISKGKQCIPQSAILVNDITNQIILGVPFINDISPLTYWNNENITGTWDKKPFILEFITKPFTRMINELT